MVKLEVSVKVVCLGCKRPVAHAWFPVVDDTINCVFCEIREMRKVLPLKY